MSGDGLIDLVVDDPEWERALPGLAAAAGTGARLALEAAGVDAEGWQVCVLACGDDRIARLNREFRGKAAPTNVLSWPGFDLAPPRPGDPPRKPPQGVAGGAPGPRRSLGDVAIALQTTRREAGEIAIPLKDHVIHLILHGCLHLLGFDHETDADAERMEGIETAALGRVGISDPYSNSGAAGPRAD